MTPWPALPERPVQWTPDHAPKKCWHYGGEDYGSYTDAMRDYYRDCTEAHAERERILRGMLEEAMGLLGEVGQHTYIDWYSRLEALRKRYEEIGK